VELRIVNGFSVTNWSEILAVVEDTFSLFGLSSKIIPVDMNKFDVAEKPVTVDVELVVVNEVFEFEMVTSLITFNSTGEAALLFPISLKSELGLEPIELFEVMVFGN
jgi:hypothetical protein